MYKGCASSYAFHEDLRGQLGLGPELLQEVPCEPAEVKDFLLQYMREHSPVGRDDTLDMRISGSTKGFFGR